MSLPQIFDDIARAKEEGSRNSEAMECEDVPPCFYNRPCCKGFFDKVVEITESKWMELIMIPWIILVIGDGAFFFFLLVGVPAGDGSNDEYWLNWSIQFLNVLFTYAALYNFPQRMKRTFDLFGHDLRRVGKPSHLLKDDGATTLNQPMFEYLPWNERLTVLIMLDLNCISQFINQAFRIVYPTYETSNVFPATLLVNLFFVLSFFFGGAAPYYQIKYEMRSHKNGIGPADYRDPFHAFIGKDEYEGCADITNAVKRLLGADDYAGMHSSH